MKTLSKDVMTSVEVNLKELAQPCYTENFTGADLKALLFNAQLKAAHAVLDQRMTQTKMDSAPSSPLSLESSPESSNKRSSSNGLVSFTYHPSFGARRHSVVPEDIEEKVNYGAPEFTDNFIISNCRVFVGRSNHREGA